MNKTKTIFWFNMLLLASFLMCFLTGIIKLRPVMALLNLAYRDPAMVSISMVHDISGILMGIFVIIHVIIYFKSMTVVGKTMLNKKAETVKNK